MSKLELIEIPYRTDALSYLEAVLHMDYPVLFDSGRPASDAGRYDIFSAAPLYTLSVSNDRICKSGVPLQNSGDASTNIIEQLNMYLQEEYCGDLELPGTYLPFYGGFAGFCSYDIGRIWEKLPSRAIKDIDLPQLQLGFYPWAGVLDHESSTAWLSFLPSCPEELKKEVKARLIQPKPEPLQLKPMKLKGDLLSNLTQSQYCQRVEQVKRYIEAGDCYQVNLSQRYQAPVGGHPWTAYKLLRQTMPAGFCSYLQLNSRTLDEVDAILSFSPERFISLKGGEVLTQPIKGTQKREANPEKDAEAASSLLESSKNRAENLMIVDLLRNDLGRCCEYGTIDVKKLFELQTVSNVHHLVSTIAAKIKPDKTAFDLLEATLPGGSITGAPKIRSMEIIEELEPNRRAIYCGALLYININGDMDSNIAIRTALVRNGQIYCWGGGGIVADSEPEAEYQESLVKIRPLLEKLQETN